MTERSFSAYVITGNQEIFLAPASICSKPESFRSPLVYAKRSKLLITDVARTHQNNIQRRHPLPLFFAIRSRNMSGIGKEFFGVAR
jgi:hypothetical protein